MIPAIHHLRQAIPEGGSQMLPNSMARYIEARQGRVLTDCAVEKIVVENGRASGVDTAAQGNIGARRAVVSALDPRQTFLKLLDGERAGGRLPGTWCAATASARSRYAGATSLLRNRRHSRTAPT